MSLIRWSATGVSLIRLGQLSIKNLLPFYVKTYLYQRYFEICINIMHLRSGWYYSNLKNQEKFLKRLGWEICIWKLATVFSWLNDNRRSSCTRGSWWHSTGSCLSDRQGGDWVYHISSNNAAQSSRRFWPDFLLATRGKTVLYYLQSDLVMW